MRAFGPGYVRPVYRDGGAMKAGKAGDYWSPSLLPGVPSIASSGATVELWAPE